MSTADHAGKAPGAVALDSAVRRRTRWTALSITVALVAGAIALVSPVQIETATAATPAGTNDYTVFNLGAGTRVYAINNNLQAVLRTWVTVQNPGGSTSQREIGQVWDDGTFRTLGVAAGTPNDGLLAFAAAWDINDDGFMVGEYRTASQPNSHPAAWTWAGATGAPIDVGGATGSEYGTAKAVNAAGDVFATVQTNSFTATTFVSALGTGPKQVVGSTLTGVTQPCGIADSGAVLFYNSSKTYVAASPSATPTDVDVDFQMCSYTDIHKMASDGTIWGEVDDTHLKIRDLDGDETVVTLTDTFLPRAINSDRVIAGIYYEPVTSRQQVAILEGGAVTNLDPLLPPNLGSVATDINDRGDIAGYYTGLDGNWYGFILKAKGDTLVGKVRRGSAPGKAYTPAQPARGVRVLVEGTKTGGGAWSGEATTNAAGEYSLAVPPGSYTATFPGGVCANTTGACSRTTAVNVVEGGPQLTRNAIAVSGRLSVTVTVSPKNVTLERDGKSGETKPATVKVTVRITNSGSKTIDGVTQPAKLTVGYAPGITPEVPTVPIRPGAGPTPSKKIGALKPGKTAVVTYTLKANGDGKYDVDALVVGGDAFGRVLGFDSERLTVGAPVLVTTLSMGKKVKSPDAPKLIKGGSAFTINVTMENRSYLKTIVVSPLEVSCRGNASDCHLQLRDLPIQNIAAMPQPSPWVVLRPRQEKKLEIVVRTTNVGAAVMLHGEVVGGGTRANVEIADPVSWELTDTGKGDRIPANRVFVDGDSTYRVGIDVRDYVDNPEPETYGGYAYYITKGVMQGLWNITSGLVCGIFVGIPTLVGKTIASVPAAVQAYIQAEVELWGAIKDDPAKVALFMNVVTNQTLLAYAQAPQLIGKVEKLEADIQAAVFAHYNEMWTAWYAGDWRTAVTAFSTEGTERAVDIATALAPGVLARFPKAVEAFNAQKAAIYAQVTEDLAAHGGRFYSAFEAVAVMADTLKPGFAMSNLNLRQLYGLTFEEAEFLREFARTRKLLIVVRSRAAESVKWIKKFGAVLKPESIKIKNVAPLDAKYLGYSEADIGRVVIRTDLPSEAVVKGRLRSNGFTFDDPEFQATLKRLETRREELSKTKDGYYQWMVKADREGKVRMKWNFAENSVDAAAYTDTVIEYPFRMNPTAGGDLVPEFYVKGKWRSITGDVDFLQITHGNGAALSDVERVAVYKDMAKSVVGMLHPESATWTDIKNNLFNFDTKVNEFVRGGTVAQFAPDGVARAVTFNKASTFDSKSTYRIVWNGGYSAVGGKAIP